MIKSSKYLGKSDTHRCNLFQPNIGSRSANNPADAIGKHVDDEDKGVAKCDTLGGKQDLSVVNESGLYALIFGSKLESAKRFKHWEK